MNAEQGTDLRGNGGINMRNVRGFPEISSFCVAGLLNYGKGVCLTETRGTTRTKEGQTNKGILNRARDVSSRRFLR